MPTCTSRMFHFHSCTGPVFLPHNGKLSGTWVWLEDNPFPEINTRPVDESSHHSTFCFDKLHDLLVLIHTEGLHALCAASAVSAALTCRLFHLLLIHSWP